MNFDTPADSLRAGGGTPLRAWLARLRTRRKDAALHVALASLNDHALRDIGYRRDTMAVSVARHARGPIPGL